VDDWDDAARQDAAQLIGHLADRLAEQPEVPGREHVTS
jgi:hypothetical protein